MGRHALLVATGEYEDPALDRLRAPAQDVERLAIILEDPDIGGFGEVEILRDVPDHVLRVKIEDLLADRASDDLVLLYFSCHGLKDRRDRLYFAATNTRHLRLAATAVSSSFVNEQIESSVARAKILILDCCFGGAFTDGFKSVQVGPLDEEVGVGHVVLTASDRYEFAYEGDSIVDQASQASIFTDVMIDGIGSGAADLDGDSKIDVDELFKYVHDNVTRRQPAQTPKKWANGAEPNIYIAAVASRSAPRALAEVARSMASNYNRRQMLVARGFRKSSDLIRRTLGPFGRTLIFEGENGQLVEASRASIIAELYKPEDPQDRLGARYVADLVREVRKGAGDGSATAVVLAQAMLDEAIAALRSGAHPPALRREMQAAVERVSRELSRLAKDVETKEQIASTASISAGDAAIGEMIAEAMDRVGMEGVITVEESNTFGLVLELTEGMVFGNGYISRDFVTDRERMEAVLEDPYILLVNSNVSVNTGLLPLLDRVVQSGKPLLVIAEDVQDEALATLVVNKIRGTLRSVAVKAPESGELRRAMLDDIAILTGGQLIREEHELGLGSAELSMLGRARKIVVTNDETMIIDGAGDAEQIAGRINKIRSEIKNTYSELDRGKLQERLAKLAGGVAVIKAGAVTDLELKERKDHIEDAVRAAQMAIWEGILPGGGIALRTAAELAESETRADRGANGTQVVVRSLSAPMTQIMLNAGLDMQPANGMGIDVRQAAEVNMLKSGIIDAAGVLRIALQHAASTVGRFIMIA